MDEKLTIVWRRWLALGFILGLIMMLVLYLGTIILFFPLYGAEYADSYQMLLFVIPIVSLFPIRSLINNYLTLNDWNWSLVGLYIIVNLLGILFLALSHNHLSFIYSAGGYYLTMTIIYMSAIAAIFRLATH